MINLAGQMEAYWLWNPLNIKTDVRRCLLDVGKMDERDFRIELWAIQSPWLVNQR